MSWTIIMQETTTSDIQAGWKRYKTKSTNVLNEQGETR